VNDPPSKYLLVPCDRVTGYQPSPFGPAYPPTPVFETLHYKLEGIVKGKAVYVEEGGSREPKPPASGGL